jgi:hypothetical protein
MGDDQSARVPREKGQSREVQTVIQPPQRKEKGTRLRHHGRRLHPNDPQRKRTLDVIWELLQVQETRTYVQRLPHATKILYPRS